MTSQVIKCLILFLDLLYFHAFAHDLCHVFCKHVPLLGGLKCAFSNRKPLTAAEKTKLLGVFNDYRYDVANGYLSNPAIGLHLFLFHTQTVHYKMPQASNMIQLEWHDGLARKAQDIAEICAQGARPCLSCMLVDGMSATWVHNFFPEGSLGDEYQNILNREVMNFPGLLHPFSNMGTDSLVVYKWRTDLVHTVSIVTAVLYSGIKYVGCGRISSWKRSSQDSQVCIFAPLPSQLYINLYTEGYPCSECPGGYTCSSKYPGLCTDSEIPTSKPVEKVVTSTKSVEEIVHINHLENEANKELCGRNTSITIAESNKYDILETYNTFRKDIALGQSTLINGLPKAADMMELVWDNELQKAAGNLIHLCRTKQLSPEQLKHGLVGGSQVKFVSVFYESNDVQEALANAIGLQGIQLTKSLIDDFKFDAKYDVLSTLISSQTRHIGCVRLNTPHYEASSIPVIQEICVFAAAENIHDNGTHSESNKDVLYIEGRQCSKCPNGFKCNTALCKEIYSGIDTPRNFCDIDKKHILCDYWKRAEEIGDAQLCQGKAPVNVTELDKAEILVNFNQFRKDLALGNFSIPNKMPSAANMLELKWDGHLQDAAERILHICSTADLRVGQLKFGNHGELQAKLIRLRHNGENFREKLTAAIQNEEANFDQTQIFNLLSKGNDNLLTALASAQAEYVGCARLTTLYEASESDEFEEVCIISPAKVESSTSLYITGGACNKCPEYYECDEGLCELRQRGIDTPMDYCKLNQKHILCNDWDRQENYGDPSKCITNRVAQQNKEPLVSAVNKFRRDLAFGVGSVLENSPKAADMNVLEWDNELANAAANIASLCSENKISSEQIKFGHHGELKADVIYIKHNGTDFEEALLKALKEGGIHYLQSQLGNIDENDIDDESYETFKSLTFSKARFFGCAQQVKVNETEMPYDVLEVCVVGPTTEKNNSLTSLFTTGDPCSKCKFGFECNDGLCKKRQFNLGHPDDNYCKIDIEHILCDEWTNGSRVTGNPELCKEKTKTIITEPERDEILGTFNQLRNVIAKFTSRLVTEKSKAADTNDLIWDSRLQEAAENLQYVCSTKELRPKQLAFGNNGELQGKVIRLRHNKENFYEKLAISIQKERATFDPTQISNDYVEGEDNFFTAFDLIQAKYLGCARMTEAYDDIDSDKFEEVCVIVPIRKKEIGINLDTTSEACFNCSNYFECDEGICVNQTTEEIPTNVATTLPPTTTTSTRQSQTTTTTEKIPAMFFDAHYNPNDGVLIGRSLNVDKNNSDTDDLALQSTDEPNEPDGRTLMAGSSTVRVTQNFMMSLNSILLIALIEWLSRMKSYMFVLI